MKFKHLIATLSLTLPLTLSHFAMAAPATPETAAPDLDIRIQNYSRVLTPEGVTREARYEETLLRRAKHVWIARVLPAGMHDHADGDHADEKTNKKNNSGNTKEAKHKHFNHVVLPRHVFQENNKTQIEFVNTKDKEIIAIPVSEYDNVNFDGSWENAFYLLDPKLVKAMPLSKKASTVSGAQWREREMNGNFQRVLWDEQKQIPLIIESGDKAGTFFRRVEVKLQAPLSTKLPWQNLKGYAQKEYADFLD